MRYVLVEDSTDGLIICEKIQEIYFSEVKDIIIESFGGALNIVKKIDDTIKILKQQDSVIVVYDDIPENPLVTQYFKLALKTIVKSGHRNQFKFISTISFELEILMIDNIDITANLDTYKTYVESIKDLYNQTHELRQLTIYTKNEPLYNGIYDKIRNRKRKRSPYKNMDVTMFESCITIESLAKELLKEIYRNQPIDRPMTQCWIVPCCHRRNLCKQQLLDIRKIVEGQIKDRHLKTNIIISNTSYKKLISVIDNSTEVIKYSLVDFADTKVLRAIRINKKVLKSKGDSHN